MAIWSTSPYSPWLFFQLPPVKPPGPGLTAHTLVVMISVHHHYYVSYTYIQRGQHTQHAGLWHEHWTPLSLCLSPFADTDPNWHLRGKAHILELSGPELLKFNSFPPSLSVLMSKSRGYNSCPLASTQVPLKMSSTEENQGRGVPPFLHPGVLLLPDAWVPGFPHWMNHCREHRGWALTEHSLDFPVSLLEDDPEHRIGSYLTLAQASFFIFPTCFQPKPVWVIIPLSSKILYFFIHIR